MPSFSRVFVAFSVVFAMACGGTQAASTTANASPSEEYSENARVAYARAMGPFESKDCLTASPLFASVRRDFPYSRFGALAELRVCDCELEQQHYAEAIRGYRSFVRAHPAHPDVDFAQYRIALAYTKQLPDDFFLSPPREERDQTSTRNALRVIRRFLTDYSDSSHAPEVQAMEHQVLSLLARHELFVANFYLMRDRPQATVFRLETLLRNYRGSGVEAEALILLGRTYLNLREAALARYAFRTVVDHYGSSGYAIAAQNFIVEMGESGNVELDTAPEWAVDSEVRPAEIELQPEEEMPQRPSTPNGGGGGGAPGRPGM